MKGKDLLSVSDLNGPEILGLIREAVETKANRWSSWLDRKVLALVFEKPSLRTRVSFEMAMREQGGECLYLSPAEVGLGKRESVPDVARVLSRYVDAIAARTFSHKMLVEFASYSRVPVVNALSDTEHPCQALADLLTIFEKKGDLKGVTIAYIGDGNNVANSLLLAASLTGMNFRIAAPPGYNIQEGILEVARKNAGDSGGEVMCTEDPKAAVDQADVLYTDVWTSMGQEEEAEARRQAFANYTVDDELLSLAREDAILMHPLPAHRGQEVSEDILDCLQSVVFDQAENRLHIQKVILGRLLGSMGFPLIGHR